jgi:hypothetical protein
LEKINQISKTDGTESPGQAHGHRQNGHDGMLIGFQITQREQFFYEK